MSQTIHLIARRHAGDNAQPNRSRASNSALLDKISKSRAERHASVNTHLAAFEQQPSRAFSNTAVL
jgi:hypothetical protein